MGSTRPRVLDSESSSCWEAILPLGKTLVAQVFNLC